jgi:hypothetical protein
MFFSIHSPLATLQKGLSFRMIGKRQLPALGSQESDKESDHPIPNLRKPLWTQRHLFARLNNHYLDWYEGKGPFLAVIGRPGIRKSWSYKSLLKDEEYTLFKGRTTALQIFMDVQDYPDRRLVFDDVGSLFHDPACIELLKSLCDSRPQRTVRWNTNTRLLEGRAKEFSTFSSVLIVGNRTLLDHDDVRAILDRADSIGFDPTKQEIITKLRTYGETLCVFLCEWCVFQRSPGRGRQ